MKYIKYALLITITLLSFSCIDNPSGLFYSLQYESDIYDGTLDNGITVGGMAVKDSYYFAACGNVKYKSIDDINWTDDNPAAYLDSEGKLSGYLCHRMIELDELYFIYLKSDDATYSLYEADVSNMSAAEGIVWGTPITIAALNGESLIDIVESNGTVFLYTETTVTGPTGDSDKRWSIYSTTDATLSSSTPVTSEFTNLASYGELDVDWDGDEFWLISGNELYRGTSGSWSDDLADTATAYDEDNADSTFLDNVLGNGFGGIYCNGSDVYLSTEEGALVKGDGSTSTATWTEMMTGDDGDEIFKSIYDFKRVTFPTYNIDVILLGAEEGYYELNLNADAAGQQFFFPEDTDTQFTSTTQFASIDMSNDVIPDFFVDTANNRIFGLGFTAGLWVNERDEDDEDWSWGLE